MFVRCVKDLLWNPVQISGPGKIVEIDETVFSRQKYHQGRILHEQWDFGGVCRENKQVFFSVRGVMSEPRHTRGVHTTLNFSRNNFSDFWWAYSHISEINGYNFRYRTVNPFSLLIPAMMQNHFVYNLFAMFVLLITAMMQKMRHSYSWFLIN